MRDVKARVRCREADIQRSRRIEVKEDGFDNLRRARRPEIYIETTTRHENNKVQYIHDTTDTVHNIIARNNNAI